MHFKSTKRDDVNLKMLTTDILVHVHSEGLNVAYSSLYYTAFSSFGYVCGYDKMEKKNHKTFCILHLIKVTS